VKLEAEGRFRVSSTPAAIIAKLFTGAGPYAVTCGPNSGNSQFSGNYDIMNYKQDVPFDDVVTFTCTLESNGPVTP
jgi:predicted secreted protein